MSSQVVYLGDEDGYIICTMASGESVKNMNQRSVLNSLVTVTALKPRLGHKGILCWTDEARVIAQLEDADLGRPPMFPYDTTVSAYFATFAYSWEVRLSEHIALVFKALSVESRLTFDSSEAFLEVAGEDIEGAEIGALRFWRYEEGEICEGRVYIARGLKVSAERRWDEEAAKYVSRDDGSRRLECTVRTAVEDVTHVERI